MELQSGKLATLEYYGNREVNGKDDRRNHAVITLFNKNDPADYFSRMSDKMLYRKNSDQTEVTSGYSASNINTSELIERLAQFNEGLNAYKKNRNINYSIGDIKAIDSEGNKLSSQQSEYFKDSKVRDENGNRMVTYQSTPSADLLKQQTKNTNYLKTAQMCRIYGNLR